MFVPAALWKSVWWLLPHRRNCSQSYPFFHTVSRPVPADKSSQSKPVQPVQSGHSEFSVFCVWVDGYRMAADSDGLHVVLYPKLTYGSSPLSKNHSANGNAVNSSHFSSLILPQIRRFVNMPFRKMAHSTISSFYFWTMLTTIATHFCHNSTAFVGKLPRISDDFSTNSTCHKKFTFLQKLFLTFRRNYDIIEKPHGFRSIETPFFVYLKQRV